MAEDAGQGLLRSRRSFHFEHGVVGRHERRGAEHDLGVLGDSIGESEDEARFLAVRPDTSGLDLRPPRAEKTLAARGLVEDDLLSWTNGAVHLPEHERPEEQADGSIVIRPAELPRGPSPSSSSVRSSLSSAGIGAGSSTCHSGSP